MYIIGTMFLFAAVIIITTVIQVLKETKEFGKMPKELLGSNLTFIRYLLFLFEGVGLSIGVCFQTTFVGKLPYHLSIILFILGGVIALLVAAIYYNRHMKNVR